MRVRCRNHDSIPLRRELVECSILVGQETTFAEQFPRRSINGVEIEEDESMTNLMMFYPLTYGPSLIAVMGCETSSRAG